MSVNNPLVAGTPLVNQTLGINAVYNAVGFYNDAAGNSHGYAYLVPTDTFTEIDVPHATSTAATGINDHNLICGFFVNGNGTTFGFVKPETGGVSDQVSRTKHSTTTQLLGINNKGQAVGFFLDGKQVPHGVFYTPHNGQWQQVDDPNGLVNGTIVNGLNNRGQLVGFYMDAAGNTHGMVVTVTP